MSLPFSKGKIKVYISSVSLDKEVKLRQQRVLQCLEARKIPHAVGDLALSASDKRELRFLLMGKPQPPPQIFNGNDHCGDFATFCLALEDETLDEFLKLKEPKKAKEIPDRSVIEGDKSKTPPVDDVNEAKATEGDESVESTKAKDGGFDDEHIAEEMEKKKLENSKGSEASDDDDDDEDDTDDGDNDDDDDGTTTTTSSDSSSDDDNDDEDGTNTSNSSSSSSSNELRSDCKSSEIESDKAKPSTEIDVPFGEQPAKITSEENPSPPTPLPPPPPPPTAPPAPPFVNPADAKTPGIPQIPQSLLADIRSGRQLKSVKKANSQSEEAVKPIKSASASVTARPANHDARPTFTADQLFKGRMALKSKYDRMSTDNNHSTGSLAGRRPNIPEAKKQSERDRLQYSNILRKSELRK